MFGPALAASLGVYDGLDGTCGNALGYGAAGAAGYAGFASILASDALWVDTSATTCASYLAVERKFLGATVDDCGGWTPAESAMDVMYGAATGTLGGGAPIANGVSAPAKPASSAFPFLAQPY